MEFSFHQKVLFKHCDPAGIVFYPRYFEMINDCVEAFFDHIGAPFEDIHKTAALPTARIEADFSAPSRHGDRLTFTLTLSRIGRTSAGLEIAATAAGAPRLTANSVIVHTDALGKPQPWPDPLRAALTPYDRSPSP